MISRKDLKKSLMNLYEDLNNSTNSIVHKLILYNMTKEDRYKYYRNMYLKDFLPTQVVDYKKPFISSDFDLEIYDRFIDNLDAYIESQEKSLNDLICKHQRAVKIFRLIITLPSPMSDVLYLTYFKQMPIPDVMSTLYMSRPTYFRNKRNAINLIYDSLNSKE